MSRRYTDAEKAAYWRKKATRGSSARRYGRSNLSKSYTPKKGKHYYAYKQSKLNAGFQERREKREATKDPGVISAIGGGIGGFAGEALGGPAGMALGTMLGGKLGHLAEKITGFGDYKIQSNTLMKGGMSQAMIVNSANRGSTIIRHREYIGDIVATSAFTITKYPLNPGQASTFPWANTPASSFEQWRARGIIFEYVSTSSDAVLSSSASTGLGSVIMATDYDALDAPFTNKRSMLNTEFACSSKPSCSFIHPVECKQSRTPMSLQYVRTTEGFPTGGDPRMYDLGNFYIATEGMQNAESTSVIGELFVIYEMELFKPQLGPIAEGDYPTDYFRLSGQTSSTWLANATASEFNTLGGTCDSGTYYFPPSLNSGMYLVTYYANGTSAVIGEVNTLRSNCEYVDMWLGVGTDFLQSPGTGTNSTSLMCEFAVNITGPNAAVGFLTAALPTGAPTGHFVVTVMSDTFSPGQ